MKQITPEIKAKVFALYWNQNVLEWYGNWFEFNSETPANWIKDAYLLLTPLRAISDEDAIECGFSTCIDPDSANFSMSPSGVFIDEVVNNQRYNMLNGSDVDFLRSRGYALPYLDWSVEDLVEAGVFKLRED